MNLKEYARLRGTNIKKLSEKSGIPASTLYAISSGDTDFDHTGISVLRAVSMALGVTSDDLYCALRYEDYEIEEMQIDEVLTADELELLTCYRQLSTKGKHAVLAGLHDYISGQ